MEKIKPKFEKKENPKEREITPKKDFTICQGPVFIELKEGKTAVVPSVYLENLKTEGVI